VFRQAANKRHTQFGLRADFSTLTGKGGTTRTEETDIEHELETGGSLLDELLEALERFDMLTVFQAYETDPDFRQLIDLMFCQPFSTSIH
jgi:hypothetical protein